MKKMPLALLCLMVLLCGTAGAREDSLRIRVPEPIKPYADNRILVTSPAAGKLTLRITSRAVDWTIAEDLPIDAGETQVNYNGLFTNGEPIHRGGFTLSAVVEGESGQWTAEAKVQGGNPAPFLQYVLPRSDTLYLKGGIWQADFHHTTSRKPQVTIRKAGEDGARPVSWLRDQEDSRVFSWDGTMKKGKIAPGDYIITFTANDKNSPVYDIPLRVVGQAPPEYPLQATPEGHFLPDSLDDDAVWRAITAPITVIKGRQIVRDKILAAPDEKAEVLGLVSSGTAGLNVLEITGDYARVGAWRLQDGGYVEGYILKSKLETLLPNQRWGLVLDKEAQTLTVYRDGKPEGKTRTSTGMMTATAPKQESRAGAFTLGQRLPYFDNLGFRYKYAVRVDGYNLMHQLGHPTSGQMNFDAEDAVMGRKASHGCLRIDRFPGEGGVNAFWLWANIPSGTKLLVLDDKPQRHARMLELGLEPHN
ncbi:MAG: L,D-transpeptidase [Eubacteriales bacterium]|nr:L,D-transpeptidase [Eubacteriales bacterium]